jgi:hypothetical protein
MFGELILSNTLAHGTGTANTAAHHLKQVIRVVGTTPFLVCDNVDTVVHLWLLDQLAVCSHALLGIGLGELIGDEGGLVETGEGNELPAVAELCETLNVGLLLVAGHGGLPVEGWGEIVGQPGGEC